MLDAVFDMLNRIVKKGFLCYMSQLFYFTANWTEHSRLFKQTWWVRNAKGQTGARRNSCSSTDMTSACPLERMSRATPNLLSTKGRGWGCMLPA